MTRVVQRILAIWIAAVVALSILLGPANATTMLDCDGTQSDLLPEAGSDHHAFESHGNVTAGDYDRTTHEHPESHCANHVCVVAIHASQTWSDDPLNLILADLSASAKSLVSLTSPDGLRRPPRT